MKARLTETVLCPCRNLVTPSKVEDRILRRGSLAEVTLHF